MTDSASQRDRDAWAIEVIQANGADLLGYLTRRTSPAADAADVLSNVLVVIWAKRTSLPLDAVAARMWSFGVARNALRDYRRQGARREKLADALRANLDSLALAHGTDPLEAARLTQRGEDIRSAIGRLPKLDRELIMLVHWDDFTLAQAAALIGMNASTARTRYSRARQRLAAELVDHRQATPAPTRGRAPRLPRALDEWRESSL